MVSFSSSSRGLSSTGRVQVELEELVLMKADARGFSFLPRQPVGSLLAGRHMSRLRGRGLSFEELRHYHQGDDVRNIDWKATARLRSPHVRVYSEERERPVLLLVDQRRSMFFGSRRAMKSVTAAELAALAAWRTVDVGDRIGGIVFNDEEVMEIRPERSQSRIMRLFHEIVRLNQALVEPGEEAAAPTVGLNNALEGALRVANHDHLIVLVSDLVGADEDTRRLATRIQAHNDLLIAAVYDPLGATLQATPGMTAMSGNERIQLPPGQHFRRDFQLVFEDLLRYWRDIFRALRIPIMPISAAEPVTDQIRSLLGQRVSA